MILRKLGKKKKNNNTNYQSNLLSFYLKKKTIIFIKKIPARLIVRNLKCLNSGHLNFLYF